MRSVEKALALRSSRTNAARILSISGRGEYVRLHDVAKLEKGFDLFLAEAPEWGHRMRSLPNKVHDTPGYVDTAGDLSYSHPTSM